MRIRSSRGYRDRDHAGRVLAEELTGYRNRDDVTVLALPRGGVPVAAQVAQALPAPLGVIVVRKLGTPGRPELAMGAMAQLGEHVELIRNEALLAEIAVPEEAFERVRQRELAALRERVQQFATPEVPAEGRLTIVVDDGLATGATMLAAVACLRAVRAAEIVVAVPVAARQAVELLATSADRVVCPLQPSRFQAVGEWYDDFTQVSDEEVARLIGPA